MSNSTLFQTLITSVAQRARHAWWTATDRPPSFLYEQLQNLFRHTCSQEDIYQLFARMEDHAIEEFLQDPRSDDILQRIISQRIILCQDRAFLEAAFQIEQSDEMLCSQDHKQLFLERFHHVYERIQASMPTHEYVHFRVFKSGKPIQGIPFAVLKSLNFHMNFQGPTTSLQYKILETVISHAPPVERLAFLRSAEILHNAELTRNVEKVVQNLEKTSSNSCPREDQEIFWEEHKRQQIESFWGLGKTAGMPILTDVADLIWQDLQHQPSLKWLPSQDLHAEGHALLVLKKDPTPSLLEMVLTAKELDANGIYQDVLVGLYARLGPQLFSIYTDQEDLYQRDPTSTQDYASLGHPNLMGLWVSHLWHPDYEDSLPQLQQAIEFALERGFDIEQPLFLKPRPHLPNTLLELAQDMIEPPPPSRGGTFMLPRYSQALLATGLADRVLSIHHQRQMEAAWARGTPTHEEVKTAENLSRSVKNEGDAHQEQAFFPERERALAKGHDQEHSSSQDKESSVGLTSVTPATKRRRF